jgi:hypothetical protein
LQTLRWREVDSNPPFPVEDSIFSRPPLKPAIKKPAPRCGSRSAIAAPIRGRPPGSQWTRWWSKADSNSESHPRATPPAATRFIADSALEGAGFEPSVPRDTTEVSRGGLCRLARDSSPTGQRANGLGREPTFTTTPGAFRGTDVRIRFPPPANRMRTRFLDQGWRRRARIPTRMCGFAA